MIWPTDIPTQQAAHNYPLSTDKRLSQPEIQALLAFFQRIVFALKTPDLLQNDALRRNELKGLIGISPLMRIVENLGYGSFRM